MTLRDEQMECILAKVRKCVGNRCICLPAKAKRWFASSADGGTLITVELTTAQLAHNMQEDIASSPIFALCLAYWYQKETDCPTRCRVTVSEEAQRSGLPLPLLHWRRSLFILHELHAILGERFVYDLPEKCEKWTWPQRPEMNNEKTDRATEALSGGRKEHELEVKIMNSTSFLESMQKICQNFEKFHRQFPIGLFKGPPRKGSHWTPGGNSQVDLWGHTRDGQTLHLFELKTRGNKKVGIISEALYYARLLHYVRVGLPDGERIEGKGEGLEAARRAKRIVTWLTAPDYHPLVCCRGDSPLKWINKGLSSADMEFRILPISHDNNGFILDPLE